MTTSRGGALAGRMAVVTGGATGIGLGITRRLIADGAQVMVGARSKLELDTAEIEHGFAGDLAEQGVAVDLIAAATELFGRVDILVNNAGGGVLRPTLEHTEETLRATIDNNLWTTIRCTLAVLPGMVERSFGRVINVGADSVRNGLIDHAIYNAAKGGVHAMTTGLAREFAGNGITVNTVAPCYVRTDELDARLAGDDIPERMRHVVDVATDVIPMGRPGSVVEVAGAVAYLARDDAGFVTGQVISVNGGTTML